MSVQQEVNQDTSEYLPELSPYDRMEAVEIKEVNALERVSSLPLVANTWDAVSSIYATAKKSYPSVSPYLEIAEKLTANAANVALATTKPVVGRIAPTVNAYANKGLDKLEDALPMIHDQPDEIYDSTKAAVTSLVNRKIDSALSVTERYVDYYLPPPADEMDDSSDEDDSDDDSDDSDSDDDSEIASPKERIMVISQKVRQRAYRRAMDRVHGVQKRSSETLNRLKFTIDLIEYARENIDATYDRVVSTCNSANKTIRHGFEASQENVALVWNEIKNRSSKTAAELHVLQKARILSGQLQGTCLSVLNVITRLPQYEYLLSQALKAKESADALAHSLADKTSIHEVSITITGTAQAQLENVGRILDALFEVLSEHAPLRWLPLHRTSKSAPEEVELEMNGEI